jgi:hypothetical protein
LGGQRFRLKANFDISGFSAANQTILRALKAYGMVIADNGASWYMSCAPDSRWDNSDLHALGNIAGSNFEAIDESSLMIDPDSGQARQPGDSYGVSWGAQNTPATMKTGVTTTVTMSSPTQVPSPGYQVGPTRCTSPTTGGAELVTAPAAPSGPDSGPTCRQTSRPTQP